MTELNGWSEDVVVGESQGAPDHDHMKLSTNGMVMPLSQSS